MLILLFVIIAILLGGIRNKSFVSIKFNFSYIFVLLFIILDEGKMILFHFLPQISNYLFVYVIVQYVLLGVFVLKYIYRLPTIVFAFGGLLNFAVISLNSSMMPISPKINYINIMNVFTSWIKASSTGYFIPDKKVTLWFASDNIIVPMFNTGLLSPGDVLIAIGIGLLIYSQITEEISKKRAKHARKKTTQT